MSISPDSIIIWQLGQFSINATLLFTWGVMLILVAGSWLVTRKLSAGTNISGWQNGMEAVVTIMNDQIRDISRENPESHLPFVGSLFLFIAVANLLTIVPGYIPPTGSLSTTTALAICVLIAVPVFGIANKGLGRYMKHYVQPTVFMLPFNITGEFSRTIALAVRLYGNIMSGTMIVAILFSVTPFFFPVVMQVLGLLTGMIQAYIFSVLAMVYIASGTAASKNSSAQEPTNTPPSTSSRETGTDHSKGE